MIAKKFFMEAFKGEDDIVTAVLCGVKNGELLTKEEKE